jgi:hypothetical protein
MAATDDGIFAGDAMGVHWWPVGSAPGWWGPLVAFTFEPTGHHVIAVSHEGVVASRRIEGGDWTPLAEALSGPRAVRRE